MLLVRSLPEMLSIWLLWSFMAVGSSASPIDGIQERDIGMDRLLLCY
jgi:hypothetical protein